MKLKLLAGTVLAALVATSGVASAEANGWYGAIDFGYHWPDNFAGAEVDNTWLWFGRLGYRLNPAWRMELEAGYRPADVQSTANFENASGDVNTWSVMANGYYDFMPNSQWRPFLGAGIGWAHPNFDLRFTDSFTGDRIVADDSSNAFAWQVMAGISWVVSPNMNVDLTYRFFQIQDASTDFVAFDAGGAPVGAGSFSDDLKDNSIAVGIRYTFGPPLPPPPPPPPPGA